MKLLATCKLPLTVDHPPDDDDDNHDASDDSDDSDNSEDGDRDSGVITVGMLIGLY